MRLRQRFLSVSIAIFMAVVLSGCSALLIGAAAGAAGTYVWTHGNLELMVNYSADGYALSASGKTSSHGSQQIKSRFPSLQMMVSEELVILFYGLFLL